MRVVDIAAMPDNQLIGVYTIACCPDDSDDTYVSGAYMRGAPKLIHWSGPGAVDYPDVRTLCGRLLREPEAGSGTRDVVCGVCDRLLTELYQEMVRRDISCWYYNQPDYHLHFDADGKFTHADMITGGTV